MIVAIVLLSAATPLEVDLSGWAALFGGLALFITAIGGIYFQFRGMKRIMADSEVASQERAAIKTELETNTAATSAVKHDTNEINHAVNGKVPGAQSMVSQVDDLHAEIPPKDPLPENGANLIVLVREIYDWMKKQQEQGAPK